MTTLTLAGVRKKYPSSKPDKSIVLSEEGLNALRAFLRCREKADDQKKAMDVYKAIILSEMRDAESADAGTHTVWAQTVESLRFDVERFSDEHEKLHEDYLTVSRTRKFDVRVKAE
jgi:predicted phage-related endonuclease